MLQSNRGSVYFAFFFVLRLLSDALFYVFWSGVFCSGRGVMGEARIGPNAIIQTVEALKELYGVPYTLEVLQRGQQAHWIDNLPTTMVEERVFLTLAEALVGQIGSDEARRVLWRCGERTAQYLLANRIPGPFQQLVKMIPRQAGFTLLLFAISKSAWTFVGSGTFHFVGGAQPVILIANPARECIVLPEVCGFYGGTFEGILRSLLGEQTRVVPASCGERWDCRCAYTVTFAG